MTLDYQTPKVSMSHAESMWGCLPVDIAIREESSPASYRRPAALPAAFLVVFQRCSMNRSFVTHWGRVVDGFF